jgi:serralysin
VDGVNGGESWREIAGVTSPLMHDNISIAYGAWIENAVGGSGDDTIVGNVVDNRLTGGAGDDLFVFGSNAGKDVVVDFRAGGAHDVIDLTAVADLDDWSDVQALITSSAAGAVIHLGTGTVTLAGVSAASLGASDFLF